MQNEILMRKLSSCGLLRQRLYFIVPAGEARVSTPQSLVLVPGLSRVFSCAS